MTTLATFQHALTANPADELTWLALADWLEETGYEPRAELVRVWLRLRGPRDGFHWQGGEGRLRELVAAGHTLPLPQATNGVGMRFVLLPPGSFTMGSPAGEASRYADEGPHRVTLTRPFWLGVWPVTQEQYRRVCGHNPSHFRQHAGPRGTAADFPVESVGWEDAVAFCAALCELHDEIRAGRHYRLPTESEWEYACRGAGVHTTPFSFGEALSSEQANFNGTKPYGGARPGPSRGRTVPCGTFPANVLGLYDLHGNVWEMCSDHYSEEPGADSLVDPGGPPQGTHRVLRGGAWDSGSVGCRSAHRGMGSPHGGDNDTGFRVVLEWRP